MRNITTNVFFAISAFYLSSVLLVMLLKPGVDISMLNPDIRSVLPIAQSILSSFGYDLVITSTYEGDHSPGSLHYSNDALDFRFIHTLDEFPFRQFELAIGNSFDVVVEDDHIHIEYDP